MAFQVSPGVNVSEVDLTTVVPAVSTTTGAIAGHFRWGTVDERVLVDSEDRLVSNFYKPNANTADDFFTAANFLSYGNSLFVVRVVDTTSGASTQAINSVTGSQAAYISNADYYNETYSHNSSSGDWVAKYPGILGNSLKISVCQSARNRQVDDAKATAATLVEQYVTDVTSGNTAEKNKATIHMTQNIANLLYSADIKTIAPR